MGSTSSGDHCHTDTTPRLDVDRSVASKYDAESYISAHRNCNTGNSRFPYVDCGVESMHGNYKSSHIDTLLDSNTGLSIQEYHHSHSMVDIPLDGTVEGSTVLMVNLPLKHT